MPTLNEVPQVDLEFHGGADVSFDVEWWEDPDETIPVPLARAEGLIAGDEISVDLSPYTTIVGNRASVHIPALTHALWPWFERAQWDFILYSVSGGSKKVWRGDVRYFPRRI